MSKILSGKKVAVLVETEYIPDEIRKYQLFFGELGAEVELLTYLWGKDSRIIVSDVTEPDKMPETLTITKDIADVNPNEYAIVLCAANYVACRLREIPPMGSLGSPEEVRSPAAVKFIAKAMNDPRCVKGFLCHALWLLTPCPEFLKGRKIICHTVVLSDVINAGAIFVPDESHVYADRDLVTGRSAADLNEYCNKLKETYEVISNEDK
ncbi:MAG: DJ-1/PfpI family protein [Firmicutes bacterium]|nr:DJ-1/PfpI family protein [Bacillota bacterium]